MSESSTKNVKQASILIVDDQPVNVKLLEKVLAAEGYEYVFSTTDSRESVELYKKHQCDLVLLDLNMPHIDGFGVMEELKKITEDYPPILVLTALKDRESRVRALEGGARDFVSKPFDRVELLSRIRNMLEVRLLNKAMKNQNLILEEKVQERTRELQERSQELHNTRLEVIQRLGRAAEYRDNETGLHIIRMSKYSQLLGRAAGMSEEDSDMILNASPMHDIGKIGIPDNILLKPGKLTPEEWEIMKTHSVIGAEILSSSNKTKSSRLMQMAREIAMTHHEKWDGSGYPDGLQGERIPLVGRVVAVADVFDALTTSRPYKKAWPEQEAVQYIRDNRGRHFDPHLVDLFDENLDAILEIRAKYPEPSETEDGGLD
ncbi:MAG: two-component system response regulator [Gammaproteobacteria bacterium]|nr:two-component system response regulator [Gammaproteobacteria bacterium]